MTELKPANARARASSVALHEPLGPSQIAAPMFTLAGVVLA
jgi:hypothetical protein